MIINFLQVRSPPILPSLQKMPDARVRQVDGQTSAFADDLEELRGYGNGNKETLGQLIFHFFRHYGYVFDYAEYVVSVKEGRLLPRKEKGWDSTNYMDKEARSRLCVEEPFNTQRNLGNSADDYAFSGIHSEIRRAFELLKDGSGLEECCAQYEFPPEEKPIFQRPPPKPKPVLVRSLSQSGRTNNGSNQNRGNGNNPRNNRNTSNQRNNNRRSSSGTAYGNQRMPYLMSPPVGINHTEYFGANTMSTDQLHNQLYKQYQYLQAQQEALRTQLLQQQQTQVLQQQQTQAQIQQVQAQAQARGVDLGTSPRSRHFTSSVQSPQSPRTFESSPTTAPLLPGYLYHYPARYPPSSPLSQSRNIEDAIVGPSSPSLPNANPALRRGVHRGSITEGSTNTSSRSQSQPGRSYPNPLHLQGLAHPGYDVSGALPAPYMVTRPVQQFAQVQTNGSVRQSNGSYSAESAMPKEYVGYYVGQSPQLVPQYQAGNLAHVPQLRDIVPRPDQRVSPDLVVPTANGMRHQSRSPSPLGNTRRHSITLQPQVLPQPLTQQPMQAPVAPLKSVESQGPVIVNGSNLTNAKPKSTSSTPVVASSAHQSNVSDPDMIPTERIQQLSLDGTIPVNNIQPHDLGLAAQKQPEMRGNGYLTESAPPAHVAQNVPTPVWRQNAPDPQGLANHTPSVSQQSGMPRQGDETTRNSPVGVNESMQTMAQLSMLPLLSPVAEIRTPSPTHGRAAEVPKPGSQHKLAHNVQIANGKPVEATSKSHNGGSGRNDGGKHHSSGNASANSWQQAPSKKGHKKNKSNTAGKGSHTPKAGAGEPLPANEADRKGG